MSTTCSGDACDEQRKGCELKAMKRTKASNNLNFIIFLCMVNLSKIVVFGYL
jgi:hypothetical protein